MHIIVCLDNQNGMLFNHRRQSKDRAVIMDILQNLHGRILKVREISEDIFPVDEETIWASRKFPSDVWTDEVCFAEDVALSPVLDKIETLTIYRWNRDYPGDFYLDINPIQAGFHLHTQTEFAGYSHEKITKEVYTR
jgi:hypothetical protein